ncbi:MAG: tRNA (adenosine(37)-N6)-threonylcarbamoyltransferase complex transferase subunit TsaD [Candidatus Pacebacteria bacterium]|nr:tRNA (adenosine(37)-N6)-threonylcarbamoyltransferase complex transferase subunit TsaD [Candidatus Paceibacterota bacterium]
MKILAIETSCDDTGIAVLDNSKILSNIVSSQIEIHRKWGGVYPALAKREHQKNLIIVLKKALSRANLLERENSFDSKKEGKIKEILYREKDLLKEFLDFLKKYKKPKIDMIAITVGPGLEPCLFSGLNFAKALSFYFDIPLFAVNHIEAHILSNFIPRRKEKKLQFEKSIFPALCLIVSGGHTQLVLMNKIGKYKTIGETRDDAAGECFDKTARILGLSYPGGPSIAKEAAKKEKEKKFSICLPRPMINSKDYDFSFSGLKTAVLYKTKEDKKLINSDYKREMAREIQQAIIDVLIKKTLRAARDFKVKTIILGGGVSANNELRKQMKLKAKGFNFFVPEKRFTGDNGAMIGFAAFLKKEKGKDWKKAKVNANLKI